MTTFGLQILTSKPLPSLPFNGRSFIISAQSWLKKTGGGCHGVATESSITAEITCLDRDETMELIDAFVVALAKSDPGVRVIVKDGVADPLGDEQKKLAASLNMAPARLTLKFLQSLTAGSFIASNILSRSGAPAFAEFVGPIEQRKDQWQQIVAAGAAQRNCHVFRSKVAYDDWIKSLGGHFKSGRT